MRSLFALSDRIDGRIERAIGRAFQKQLIVHAVELPAYRFVDLANAVAAHFETRAGEWITTHIPFDRFLPTFRGRTLRDVPSLDASRIRQVGMLVSSGVRLFLNGQA